MNSRICHTIDAILSFVIILTEIDKINKLCGFSKPLAVHLKNEIIFTDSAHLTKK